MYRKASLGRHVAKDGHAALETFVEVDPIAGALMMDANHEIGTAVTIQIGEDGTSGPVLCIQRLPGKGRFGRQRLEIPALFAAHEQAIAMTNEDIRSTVVVEVRYREGQTENVGWESDLGSDIGKPEAPQVATKPAAGTGPEPILQNQQVQCTVAVVVKDTNAPCGAGGRQAFAAGSTDVDKCAAIVAKECRAP